MCGANAILFPTRTIQINGETDMLSPHEFATLMLVNAAADQIDPTREEAWHVVEASTCCIRTACVRTSASPPYQRGQLRASSHGANTLSRIRRRPVIPESCYRTLHQHRRCHDRAVDGDYMRAAIQSDRPSANRWM